MGHNDEFIASGLIVQYRRQVYRTLVVWSHNVLVILIPSGFLIVDAGA